MQFTNFDRFLNPRFSRWCLFVLAFIFMPLVHSQEASDDPMSFLVSNDEPQFLPVEEAYQVDVAIQGQQVILHWIIEPNYYLYKDKFSFEIDGHSVEPQLETGKLKFDEYFEKDVEVYYKATDVRIALTKERLASLNAQPAYLSIKSQGCADAGLCYPPYKQVFKLDVVKGNAQELTGDALAEWKGQQTQSLQRLETEPPSDSVSGDGAPFGLLLSLIFALVGGAILNLMPCVFPVLSIKALSLSTPSKGHSKIHHGWAYTAGCVATFVSIAAIMLLLRSSGEAIGWGFQLQSPVVITLLVYLFVVMGLSFSGFIHFGESWMGVGQAATQGDGLKSSFFTGALASVVASPCTAPMMGSALGYAITQPAPIALLVFASLGLGMAMPYLLLTYLPQLASKLPKPGAWMDTLKQALAFPMYLAAVWLFWVLTKQVDNNFLALVGIGLVSISFALWLIQQLPAKGKGLWAGRLVAVLCVVSAASFAFRTPQAANDELWQPYSPDALQTLRDSGQPVLVNLTASWCITCLANERVALSKDSVRRVMKDRKIQGLKGDWTNHDPVITELLNKHGRSGVPLYLFYSAGSQEPVILPQLLTPSIVLNVIAPKQQVANH